MGQLKYWMALDAEVKRAIRAYRYASTNPAVRLNERECAHVLPDGTLLNAAPAP
jgi:hypothetical protein